MDRHTDTILSLLSCILIAARQQNKLFFKGQDRIEMRNKLRKLPYLVEDSFEKPAWKENIKFE